MDRTKVYNPLLLIISCINTPRGQKYWATDTLHLQEMPVHRNLCADVNASGGLDLCNH